MRFLNSVPGDQFTARRAATWISSPVRMFRFVRGPRSVGRQAPKFAIETRSPDSRRAMMTSNAVRSTSRTFRSVMPCVLAATSLARLARPYMPLFPRSLKDGSFLWWNARIRHCNAAQLPRAQELRMHAQRLDLAGFAELRDSIQAHAHVKLLRDRRARAAGFIEIAVRIEIVPLRFAPRRRP